MSRRLILGGLAALLAAPAVAQAADTPVQPGSPWPEMRHDRRNTGRSDIVGRYRGDRPWHYQTGKGIFSTPILGADGTTYVGSADSWFYAVGPGGRLRWRFKTGNLIDSAATIDDSSNVYVPSGDEYLYRLRTGRGLSRAKRVVWRFHARQPPGSAQLVDWWEGNVELGTDGTLYAGNTGSTAYAIHRDGTLKWQHGFGNSPWTAAARAPDGSTYWGSLDLFVHKLDKNGNELWKTPTVGFVISSPALSKDGSTLYIGSFDSNLYALDTATGAIKWKFDTDEHIYSSPALDEAADGTVKAIVFGSTDGSVYAVNPDGTLKWRYETGDVIRSSPVIGQAPGGGEIVYVGNGAGTLFALDAATGRRRWSYDTTATAPSLRDRNDLNSSPALGRRGIVIGGEDGRIHYVPYDYCLHRSDLRCSKNPGSVFAASLTRIFPVTAGGNTLKVGTARDMNAASMVPARLVVRSGDVTQDAAMQGLPSPDSLVTVKPPFPFTAHLSGDGHDLFVVPDDFLAPDTDYTVHLAGAYAQNGAPVGDARVGATGAGTFAGDIRFHTARSAGPLPLHVGARRTSAFELSRLAVPLPAFLPSVNQIGFDGYDWLVAPVSISKPDANGTGTALLWVISARRLAGGGLVPDPAGNFLFPLSVRYRRDAVMLDASDIWLTFSFGRVPLHVLQFRGQLQKNLRFRPGANLLAQVNCPDVPTYGAFLPLFRLCNSDGQLVSSGTFLTRGYDGPAEAAVKAVSVGAPDYTPPSATQDGRLVEHFTVHGSWPAKRHQAGVVLADAATGAPVQLDYRANTTVAADRAGNVATVTLTIPKGTAMPPAGRLRAYVMTDVFRAAAQTL
ncbi:MAG: hypothetical protein JWM71_1888 [Solirubrobacteraceae bacterium]|nr:hypothetical protein [Solirubrobacteraceae bacterium]